MPGQFPTNPYQRSAQRPPGGLPTIGPAPIAPPPQLAPQPAAPLNFGSLPGPPPPIQGFAPPRTAPESGAARRMVSTLQGLRQGPSPQAAGPAGPGLPNIPGPDVANDLRSLALDFPQLTEGLNAIAQNYEAAEGAREIFASEGAERGLPGMADIAGATSPHFQGALDRFMQAQSQTQRGPQLAQNGPPSGMPTGARY